MDITAAFRELTKFIESNQEFLIINSNGKAFALKSAEFEKTIERGRILITFLDDSGYQTWRILALEQKENELILDLAKNFETEHEKLRIIPRIAPENITAEVEAARIEKANETSSILESSVSGVKTLQVRLNKQNGRFAQITFQKNSTFLAALSDITESAAPEILISNAVFWLLKLENRKKNPIFEVWIIAEKRSARALQKLSAVLTERWKNKIRIFAIAGESGSKKIEEKGALKISDLWREKPAVLKLAKTSNLSRTAREIIKFSENEIDCVSMQSGESLRFLGLRFARVRRMFESEKCWFGIERERRILSEKSFDDFEKLIADMKLYRTANSPYKRHEFYRAAPEAWLEAILRKNIKLLDANVVLSPIYNQFRAANDKIDLLALRRDGRLVIIELKVSPDREMIYQAADYWRKIELQRRKGVLQKAKVFGDLEIADKPAIVYLVAPSLGFHPDLLFLAKTVAPDIEIYRFDIGENWRENVKVLRREKLCGNEIL